MAYRHNPISHIGQKSYHRIHSMIQQNIMTYIKHSLNEINNTYSICILPMYLPGKFYLYIIFILPIHYLYIKILFKLDHFFDKKNFAQNCIETIFFWLIAFTRSKLPVLQVNSIKCSGKLTQFQLIVDQGIVVHPFDYAPSTSILTN